MEQSVTFLPCHLKAWSPYPYIPHTHYFLNWYRLFLQLPLSSYLRITRNCAAKPSLWPKPTLRHCLWLCLLSRRPSHVIIRNSWLFFLLNISCSVSSSCPPCPADSRPLLRGQPQPRAALPASRRELRAGEGVCRNRCRSLDDLCLFLFIKGRI